MMFQTKRCRIGSSITASPIERMQEWTLANISRLIFAVIYCVIWFGLYFAGCQLVVFLGTNVAQTWAKDSVSAMEFFNHPTSGIVKIIGCVVIFIYVIVSTDKTR